METKTPTNLWKLIAKHQVKFIHGRTVSDLEDDINKRLDTNMWQYEIKSITLDLSWTGSRLGMIHYYAQSRIADNNKTVTTAASMYQSQSLTKEVVNIKRKSATTGETKHVAPVMNTPATNNNAKEFGKVQMNIDEMKISELDNMWPNDTIPSTPTSTPTPSVDEANQDINVEVAHETNIPDPATEVIENDML